MSVTSPAPASPGNAAPRGPSRSRNAPFTPEEERQIAQTIERGREAAAALSRTPRPRARARAEMAEQVRAGEEARHLMVTRNVPLVARIAHSYRNSGVELADLIQEGTVGLIKAVDTFDWRYGAPFSTWANRYIKQSIERNGMVYTSLVRLPVDALYDRHNVLKTRDAFMAEHHREPSVSELAALTDRPEERVRALLDAPMDRISIDPSPEGNVGTTEDRVFVADDGTEDQAILNLQTARASEALAPFTPDEIKVLMYRTGIATGEAMSIKEVATVLGFAPRAVHMMEQSFVAKAKHPRFAMIPNGGTNRGTS